MNTYTLMRLKRAGWTAQKARERRDNALTLARKIKEAKHGAWKSYVALMMELARKYHAYLMALR